jgi:hypothetical protein
MTNATRLREPMAFFEPLPALFDAGGLLLTLC